MDARADVTAELKLGGIATDERTARYSVAPFLSLLVRPSYDTDEPAVK